VLTVLTVLHGHHNANSAPQSPMVRCLMSYASFSDLPVVVITVLDEAQLVEACAGDHVCLDVAISQRLDHHITDARAAASFHAMGG